MPDIIQKFMGEFKKLDDLSFELKGLPYSANWGNDSGIIVCQPFKKREKVEGT